MANKLSDLVSAIARIVRHRKEEVPCHYCEA